MKETGEDHLCLKRRNFESHLMNGIRTLFLQRDLGDTDVTLSAEEKYIQCHKWLLSLCSPYFNKLFRQTNHIANKAGNTVVILTNLKFRDLENLIYFVYNGEVKVKTDEEVQGVLQAGVLLKIEGLAKPEIRVSGIQDTQSCNATYSSNSNKMTSTTSLSSSNEIPTDQHGPTLNTQYFKKGRSITGKKPSLSLRQSFRRAIHGNKSSVEIPSVAKRTRYDVETSLVGISKDHDELNSYNTGQIPLKLEEVRTEEDDLSLSQNVGVDPSTLDEGLCPIEPIEVKLENVDYQKTQDFTYEDDELDEEQSGSEEIAVGSLTEPGGVTSKITGVPWYFEKYYGPHMSKLMACFENMTCMDCGFKFAKKYHMARHFVTHVPPNYPCRVCGLKMSNDSVEYSHMKSKHGLTKHKL